MIVETSLSAAGCSVVLGIGVVMCLQADATGAEASGGSPITISLRDTRGFATFANRLHPDNRIGYRFHEHTPIVLGDVPRSDRQAGIDPAKTASLESRFLKRPGLVSYRLQIAGKEGWAPQQWTFHMVPVTDGIDLLLVVETDSQGLNAYYGVQQCFRMSGKTNQPWRRGIAETPAFSEYDHWRHQEASQTEKTSLTYVLRKGHWQALPASTKTVGARTPLGIRIDTERSGGDLAGMTEVGPYHATMLEPVDCGLIARADEKRTWVCGIYWERTSHVTDHHPADCLHSIVNIGGIPPKSKRAVLGKIYWFKGTLDELAKRWRRDFPDDQPAKP